MLRCYMESFMLYPAYVIVLIKQLLSDLFTCQTLVHVLLLAIALVVMNASQALEAFL